MWTISTADYPAKHTCWMARRDPIPSVLAARPFVVRTALAEGVTKDRLRSRDLQRPFHGTRTIGLDLSDRETRCRAYAAGMPADHVFSHVTAAMILDIPIPQYLNSEEIHVSAPHPRRAPQGRGIVGHQEKFDPAEVLEIRGIRVSSAASTWCALASALDLCDLVAAGDYLLTGNPFKNVLPPITKGELASSVAAKVGVQGQRARVAALHLIREGPLSRPESLVRLLLAEAGIPEAQLNQSVYDTHGSFVAMPDFIWPNFRVALEYEGDHHRETKQFRQDIGRIERLIDEGWDVTKATADELFTRPTELAARVARRLRSRGWDGRERPSRQMGQFRR